MSSVGAKWPETPSSTSKWHTLSDWQNSLETIDPAKWAELMPNGLKRRLPLRKGTFWKIGRILWQRLADFLKTNLAKSAVIWVRSRQKAGFLKKLQNHSNEGKGKKKATERGEWKEGREKNNDCSRSFHNSYFGRKKLLDANGPFGDNVVKNLATYYSGALARAKRAPSGAPWVRKFGKLSIRENLVMT